MEFIKKFWDKIKSPRPLYVGLFYLFFILIVTGTILLVVFVPRQNVCHYILYIISAISLVYFVYTIVHFGPRIKHNIVIFMKKFKFTSNLLDNYGYRTVMFSICSFSLNLLYVIFIGVLGIITHSAWYISITVYYLFLTIMKGNIFYSKKRYDTIKKEARTFRFTGIMFILLTIVFSGIIVLIYTSNMYFEYAGIMIYAVAVFTFYKLTLAIYNLFKARKHNDLYVQNIRNINFVSALVSIVVLQVAMFQAFSPENNASVANGLTGGLISAITFVLGIFMILKANKILKQRGNDDEE